MALSLQNLWSVLAALFVAFCCHLQPTEAAIPSNVAQVDLVFPRNDSVYYPVYPFPIVFAMHNPGAVWHFNFHMDWELAAYNANSSELLHVDGGVWKQPSHQVNASEVPSSPWLAVYGVRELANYTHQFFPSTPLQYVLRIEWGITYACDKHGDIPRNHSYDITFQDGVFFNISATNGVLPDIEAAGPCAHPIGAIAITGEANATSSEALGLPCPILADSRDHPRPVEVCAFSVDKAVASQVSSQMLTDTSCNGTDMSWPNATLVDNCKKAEAVSRRAGGAWIVAMVVPVLLGILLLVPV